MTEIRLNHYSCGMISDFHLLSEKIVRLAGMAESLRRENSGLRLDATALAAENADLRQRIDEAHRRVSALLEQLPAPEQDEEAA